MSKYSLVIILVIAITLGVAGWLFLKPVTTPQEPQPQNIIEETMKESAPQKETETSTPQSNNKKQTLQNLILYTNNGFSPATLTIKKGDSVTFQNNSQESMWVASAFHPTHTVYPTTGGCSGSTFDSCAGITGGNSWTFQFDIAGSWKYHNHLNPSKFGTIIVE